MSNKELVKVIEGLLYNYESVKAEIKNVKDLANRIEEITPTELAYVKAMGIDVSRKRTREEIDYVIKFLKDEIVINNPYQIPCEYNVLNAEFCSCMNIHMSKCPLVNDTEYECPMYSPSIPKESFEVERFSQYWLNNFPEVIKEIESYLERGEMPDSKLFRIAISAKAGYESGDILKYFKDVKKKFKQPPKRQSMSPRLRFKILNRDNFTCKYCGRKADDGVTLHVDHIHPVVKGGTDAEDNLITACQDCNLGKSDNEIGGE